MASRAKLIATRLPKQPSAAVIVMHGGGGRRRNMMVSPTQLSVLRMIPIAKRLAHIGRGRLAVFRLLNSTRGWDTKHTPVDDAHWALGEIRTEIGPAVPTSLVGHSLGGRAALLAGSHPDVASVVALNPYLYPADGHTDLSGRPALIVHGTNDHIASPATAEAVARALGRSTRISMIRVRGGKHAMLRRHSVFDRLAAEFVAATVLDTEPSGVLAQALANDAWQDV
jgi:pimeloyl-ACP methyl ester carboxylesterase